MKFLTKLKPILASLCLLGFFSLGSLAYAQSDADQSLGDISKTINGSVTNLGYLMVAVAYIAGFSFACAAVFKLKAWKDNPQQNNLGTPIAFLSIAVFLVFLPSLLGSGGQTIFGGEKTAGGFGGSGIDTLDGGST